MNDIQLADAKKLLTSAVDWFLMTGLRNRYELKHFVETGTAGGTTAINAAAMFQNVWSVEIDPERAADAARKCRNLDNVRLYEGDSLEVLPVICEMGIPDAPALFYLDAHWCGGDRVGAVECPLLEEIKCIRHRWPKHRDVVVIDNVGLLANPPKPPHRAGEWPTLSDVVDAVVEDCQILSVDLVCDQLLISPEPLFATLHYPPDSRRS